MSDTGGAGAIGTDSSSAWAPVPDGSGFGLANLPYGVATVGGDTQVVVRIGDSVLPVAEAAAPDHRHLFERPDLNAFLAAGPDRWADTRRRGIAHRTAPDGARPLLPVDGVAVHLPIQVRDYVDFYSSLHHATNLGKLFRPDADPLLPNWRHLPVAYHGRAGTVVRSGTPVIRPTGLVSTDGEVTRRPCAALDFELEVGFVVGPGNEPGVPIPPDDADRHVFGLVLVNDWSARDIQAFEYQPLGPFLGKSFLTTVSPWVVPLEALRHHLVPTDPQDPPPDAFFTAAHPWSLDVELAVDLNGTEICRTNLRHLYWTFAQQIAHLTSNGATTGPGDLFATGTVSGPTAGEQGSLIEATWRGRDPLRLADGTERTWLLDGDTLTLRGWSGGVDDQPLISFGEATGTVLPAGTTAGAV